MITLSIIYSLAFEDEITLYWDFQKDLNAGLYKTFINDKLAFTSGKTHAEIVNLSPDTEYSIRVEMFDKNGKFLRKFGEKTIKTTASRKRIDVTQAPYNAVADGVTLNTKAIQQAINDCKDGESVYFPKGTYLTGALDLHSNMELYIEKGATLKGTVNVEDYLPKRESRFEGHHLESYSSLINMGQLDYKSGFNCFNVVIRGGGIIDGGGKELCDNIISVEKEKMADYLNGIGEKLEKCDNMNVIPARTRGRLINISNSQNVIVANVGIYNSPSWNLHPIYSDNIVVYGCEFFSEGIWNGDGFDPDSSTNCTIFSCDFSTGDNCIAIKSGKNPDGNIVNRPTKNIKIFDCKTTVMGGGCAIGSEMSGGVEDVYVWDCDFVKSNIGLTVKASKDRGSYVRNLYINNCIASNFLVRSKYNCNGDGEPAPTVPYFENFYLDNVTLTGWNTRKNAPCTAILLSGFENEGHALKNVVLNDITLLPRPDGNNQSIQIYCAEGVTIKNLKSL